MNVHQLSGRQFFKLLLNNGIPASSLAFKANASLEKIYSLKQVEVVPQRYIELLVSHFSCPLPQVIQQQRFI